MKFHFILAFLLLSGMVLSAAEVVIKLGETAIVYKGSAANKLAAEDLQKHLELITSEKVVLAKEHAVPAGKTFLMKVGFLPDGVSADKFAPQESHYRITPEGAYFYGGRDGGASFAVYDFLEDSLNVRWPSGEDIAAPRQNPVRITVTQGDWYPKFTLRNMRTGGSRMGSKNRAAQLAWKRRLRNCRGSDWNFGPGDAYYAKWWKKYGKDHPEYFAMNIQGVRGPSPSRVRGVADTGNIAAYQGKDILVAFCCTSEPYLDAVIAQYEKIGKPVWLNFCQPDVMDYECCYCEKCRALDGYPVKKGEKFHGNRLSDRYVYMLNRLYEKAVKIRPDVKIMSEIYNFSQEPPVRTKIAGPDNCCFTLCPTDFTLEGIDALLAGWNKAGMRFFTHRPNRHGYFITILPCGYEEHFFKILQKMVKAGAAGFDYDCANTFLQNGQWFSDYVLLKAMQEPEKDFAYWEKHYMQAFAPAQEEISAYYGYWRNEVWNKRLAQNVGKLQKEGRYFNFGRGLVYNLKTYYEESDFSKAGEFLKKALERKDLPEDVRKRIEALSVDNEHHRLTFLAITKKSDEASIALRKFRMKHNYALFPWAEQYWGDVCGLKKVDDLKDFDPPFKRTPSFWYFKLDPKDAGVKEEWYKQRFRKIANWGNLMATNNFWETPHKHYKVISPEIRAQTANYDGIAWYGTALDNFPLDWKGRRVFLYFGAVDESCWIYVNGKKAGEHLFVKPDDWRSPFSIEITDCIDWDSPRQVVVVRVADKSGGGGIWKDVMLVSKLPEKK
ncbi:MAG: DUF4838 domain-containing protein [Lentisphaerae bacterium]|nr:DUF4838 domain-containing protein [Lentisphaerota bacterium]